jgi:hypothetical protein
MHHWTTSRYELVKILTHIKRKEIYNHLKMCHIIRKGDTHQLSFTIFLNHNDFGNKPIIKIQHSILVFSIRAIQRKLKLQIYFQVKD